MATQPCVCGYLGDPRRSCTCDPGEVLRYRSRISGPLRDRIDLHLSVGTVPFRELQDTGPSESSACVRGRVVAARERQAARAATLGVTALWNAGLGQRELRLWCRPDPTGASLLEDASDRLGLSARGVHRVLKVGRTIADLEGRECLEEDHLAEALQCRSAEP